VKIDSDKPKIPHPELIQHPSDMTVTTIAQVRFVPPVRRKDTTSMSRFLGLPYGSFKVDTDKSVLAPDDSAVEYPPV
jgi:hypothetical protein